MFIAAIILGLIVIGLIILINHISRYSNGDFDTGFFFGICLTIVCIIEIAIVNNITEKPHPTSIDVYQGKTTLEYTIRDGEVIDSVVVFKNSVYGKQN